jgi:hypothetical protein
VNGVAATKEAKQLLDGIVSSMMGGEKDDGVSATGKVAANGVAAEGGGKSETSAGRSCFGNENDEGMGCFSDLGRNEKCRSEMSRRRGNGHQCSSAVFRHRRNEQCCTAVFQHRRNEQCCTAVFQHHEKSSVLKNGVSAS